MNFSYIMKNLSKLVIFLFFFFATSFFAISYFLSPILAEDPNPIPQPRVPCFDEEDPEFNSLRPYQASPCGKAPQSYFCGNKIIINESKTKSKKSTERSIACPDVLELEEPWKNVDPGTTDNPKDYFIDMSEIELPILGNTQEVQNSQRANDGINDAQKMNEYVSWYLNGVINRAEYGESKNTPTELVNFSGPINKLMPSMILEAQRIESIKNATAEYGQPVGSPSPEDNEGPSSHNQIVVCSESNIPIIGNLLNLGEFKPVECYKGDGSSAKGFLGLGKEVSRLADWEGDLSVWNSVTNAIIDAISRVAINISRDVIAQSIGDHWNKRIPPLPWSNMEGKPFESDILYRKAYNEWKGKTCVLIPGIEWLICFENIFVPNRYADLYPYIPLANTSDRQYKMPINTITIQPTGGTEISFKKWWVFEQPPGEPLLYYPHAIETKELTDFLNKTYIPSGTPSGEVDPMLSEINGYNRSDPEQCRTIDVRTNEGDNLFPIAKRDGKDADIAVEVYFEVTKLPRVSCIRTVDPMTGEDEWKGTFHGEVNIEIQTNPIQVPNADQIWTNTVSGAQSTVKRIFPKIGEGSPIECLADIPGESKAVYKPTKGTEKIGVSSMGLNAESYDPLNAELHFPHLGSVYEYFLKGIQTALRPKGYGEPIPNGLYCKTDEEEEEDMCPVVEDSKVPEKWLGEYKANYLSKADTWTNSCSGPENNLAEECYNYVVTESLDKGVNPAFSLTMWLEESDASNYCYFEQIYGEGEGQDFGINRANVPKQNIVKQLAAFLDLAQEKLCSGTTGFAQPIHGWLNHFRSTDYARRCDPTDPCGYAYVYGGSCTVDGALRDYGGIINIWQIVNNTVSGNCINNGRFAIDWPTSMSCP